MTKQEQTLFQRSSSFGFATCHIKFDQNSKAKSVICIDCNEVFAKILSSSIENIKEKPLSMPNFNLIEYINGGMTNSVLYTRGEQHYKIEIVTENIQNSTVTILLTEITQQILYYNLQNNADRKELKEVNMEHAFLNLIKNSQDPMLLFSGGEFLVCNDAAAAFLGYASGEEVKTLSPVEMSPEYQPNGILSAEYSASANAIAIKNGYNNFDWVHLKKDKTPIWVNVTLTYMLLDGQPLLQCIWKDLTEKKKLEAEINEQQERILNQLSIPITEVFKGILLLPLVGNISETRANNILQKVLSKIASSQSKVLIIDISGINDMTAVAAKHILYNYQKLLA